MSVNEWALLFVAAVTLFCALALAFALALDRLISRAGRRK